MIHVVDGVGLEPVRSQSLKERATIRSQLLDPFRVAPELGTTTSMNRARGKVWATMPGT